MRVTRWIACLGLGLPLTTSPLGAQDTINTMAAENYAIAASRTAGNGWWGEVFTVPAASSFLTSFSFQIGSAWSRDGPVTASFSAWILRWRGPGTSIFSGESPLFGESRSTDSDHRDLNSIETFVPQNPIPVFPGEVFVAFIWPEVGSFVGWSSWYLWPEQEVGTTFVYSQPVGSEWESHVIPWWNNEHMGFQATFSGNAVPEPATFALLATGLLGIAGVALRRRGKPA